MPRSYNTCCGREAVKGLDGSVADEGLHFLAEMEGYFDALSDMAVYLWCCVRSACQADGVAFDMDLMTFLDSLAPEDLTRWSEQAGGEAATSEEDAADDKAQKKAAGNPEALRICIGRDAAGS